MGKIRKNVNDLLKDRIVVPNFSDFPLHKRILLFGRFSVEQLACVKEQLNLFADLDELVKLQQAFNAMPKAPTVFELKLIDAYAKSERGYALRAISGIDIKSQNPYIRRTLEMYNELRTRHGVPTEVPRTFADYAEAGPLFALENGADTVVKTSNGIVAEFNCYKNSAKSKYYLRFLSYFNNDINIDDLKSNLGNIYAYGYKPIALIHDEFDGATPQKRMISAYAADLLNVSAFESTEKCPAIFTEPISKVNLLSYSERAELSGAEITGREAILLVDIREQVNKISSKTDRSFLYCDGVSDVIPTDEGIINGLIKLGFGFEIDIQSIPIEDATKEEALLTPNSGYAVIVCKRSNLSKVMSHLSACGCKSVNVGRLTKKGYMSLVNESSELMRLDINIVRNKRYDKRFCIVDDVCDATAEKEFNDPIEKIRAGIDRGFLKSDYALDPVNGANTLYPRLLGKKRLTTMQSVTILPEYNKYDNVVNLIASGTDGMKGDAFTSSARSALTAILKLVVSGVPLNKIALGTDFFYDPEYDNETSGLMLSGLLGCAHIQREMAVGSVGTRFYSVKMSVPEIFPAYTAVGMTTQDKVVTPLFDIGDKVYKVTIPVDEYGMPNSKTCLKLCGVLNININIGNITAGCVIEHNESDSIVRGTVGNGYGFRFARGIKGDINSGKGDILLALKDPEDFGAFDCEYLGVVDDSGYIACDENKISQNDIECAVTRFPYADEDHVEVSTYEGKVANTNNYAYKVRPNALILHMDFASEKAIHTEAALMGFDVTSLYVGKDAEYDKIAPRRIRELIERTDFLILAGRSGYTDKYGMYELLRNPSVLDALNESLFKKGALVLGTGEGAKALFKLGFLTKGNAEHGQSYGIRIASSAIGELTSRVPYVRVDRNISALLRYADLSAIYPVGCGGADMRIDIDGDVMDKLVNEGRACARFVNSKGQPTEAYPCNPEGSSCGVTALCSPNGNVLGIFALPEKTCTLINSPSLMRDILRSALMHFAPTEF